MLKKKFKSFAKINLFLNVGKKFKKTKLHNIQSLVCLINLFDEIEIYKIRSKKDKIKFTGKFCDNINKKKNTIIDTLSLLRNKGIIDVNTKYNILVKKKIPIFSGLGGGSSNAAFLLKNLITKKELIDNKSFFSKHLGSDLKLFFGSNQIFQKSLNRVKNLRSKLNFYFIIVYPYLKSPTKEIYSRGKFLAKYKTNKIYENGLKKIIMNNLLKEQNHLEKIVTSKFPIIKKILFELRLLKKCQFSRVTGSGSACFGVFLSKKSADLGVKKIRKKFPKFWCVVGKTI